MERDDKNWIQTYSGRQFWPLDPRPEDISIIDVAHSLSLDTRFSGHCRTFYSTGQHSILVSYAVPWEHEPCGLMHDTPEAFLRDLARPIKHDPVFGIGYRAAEERLWQCFCAKYGLPVVMPPEVKYADRVLLMTERRDLMARPPRAWTEAGKIQPLPKRIVPMPPKEVERLFLYRFVQLFPKGPYD